jgi:hypothetical protein
MDFNEINSFKDLWTFMKADLKKDVKAYKDRREEKQAAKIAEIKAADAAREKREKEAKYLSYAPEIAEIARALAYATRHLKPPQPSDILLPFNGVNYDYVIRKVQTNLAVVPTLCELVATLAAISEDRIKLGHSPSGLNLPLRFTAVDKGSYIVIRLDLTVKTNNIIPLPYNDIGGYIGIFRYDPTLNQFYIGSIYPQYVNVGNNFQLLCNKVWLNTSIEKKVLILFDEYENRYEEIYYVLSGTNTPPENFVGTWARLVK